MSAKHFLLISILSAPFVFTGCASTVAKVTGDEPVGVSAKDRTISQRLRDSGIESNALVNLYKLDKRFDVNARVRIHAFHDAVLIVGQVPDRAMIPMATENVSEIAEVKVVHNELQFGAEASYGDVVDDRLIKTSIRKNLLLESGLKDSRVKVVVERGVVYLMGVLSQNETNKVLAIVQKTSGIKKIISLIDDVAEVEKQLQQRKKQLLNHQKLGGSKAHPMMKSSNNMVNTDGHRIQNGKLQKPSSVTTQKLTNKAAPVQQNHVQQKTGLSGNPQSVGNKSVSSKLVNNNPVSENTTVAPLYENNTQK